MGLILSLLSVLGEENGRLCKFCYGDEGDECNWLHPCKCIGTLYWVHNSCFDLWMSKASAQQQLQCQTCKYVYQKSLVLKHYTKWSIPRLDLNKWQVLEILLDIYSTYKFIRGFVWLIEGKRGIVMQIVHCMFWRCFIMTDRRTAWYMALSRKCLSAVFDVNILPYCKERSLDEHDDTANELNQVVDELAAFGR